jgi:hypothetical protein
MCRVRGVTGYAQGIQLHRFTPDVFLIEGLLFDTLIFGNCVVAADAGILKTTLLLKSPIGSVGKELLTIQRKEMKAYYRNNNNNYEDYEQMMLCYSKRRM